MKKPIDRWPGAAPGRSRVVGFGDLVWVVANATVLPADFRQQVVQTLERLEASLVEAGSDRTRLLSVQVFLMDMETKPVFDELWQEWIGPDSAAWPQRACIEAGLAPGLLVELTAMGVRG